MRVLLIEPDEVTRMQLELILKSEDFYVTSTDNGEDGFIFAKDYEQHVIVMELALPDMNGVNLIRNLRTDKVRTPIMVVSGSADVTPKVQALSAGADDYLVKPFHKDELTARLHAIARRSAGHSANRIHIGDMVVDIDNQVVTACGQDIELTGKEYGMVELMALRQGVTLTKDMFLNHLYGGRDEPELKIIDVFVCKIRKKLARHTDQNLIQTIWGRGYVLSAPEKAAA